MVARSAAWRDVLDLQCNNIAGLELTIDGQVEHRKIARSSLCLEFAPDGPDVFGSQRRLGSCKFSFVPWLLFWPRNEKGILIFHGHAPPLVGMAIMEICVRLR